MPCELCENVGGQQLFANGQLRVVLVDDANYPGFTRVIWHEHVKEMTDLSEPHRQLLMRTVFLVEQVQRDVLAPTKINLASLGNMTPHLHWHIIPRWQGDATFPQPIWAGSSAEQAQPDRPKPVVDLQAYASSLKAKLNQSD
jgi:diadenosine tetraphosphate (Ap4A) HIT family hydrolase